MWKKQHFMKTKIYKTNHFWQRAWERGFHQGNLDKLIKDLKPTNRKTLIVFGKKQLREVDIKMSGSSHLILVLKGDTLVTLFEVPSLFNFFRSNPDSNILF